jgi:hypothetical protein
VYVAGPYSADNVLDVLRHIGTGLRVCEELFRRGFAPFCPWADHQYEFYHNHTKEDYYESSIAWLDAADVIYVHALRPGSVGTAKEIELAKELHIPVFFDIASLEIWKLKEWDGK